MVDVVERGDGSGVVVRIKKETLESRPDERAFVIAAGWIIGADGGRSAVRTAALIEFEGFTWPKEEFVATNVNYPFDQYGYTNRNFIIDPVNWAIIAKINNQGLWRVAYGKKPGMADAQIREELPHRYKYFLPGPRKEYLVERVNRYRPIRDALRACERAAYCLLGMQDI